MTSVSASLVYRGGLYLENGGVKPTRHRSVYFVAYCRFLQAVSSVP